MSKFYTFRQNNSGGSWDFNPKAGISVNVIVEAIDEHHAISRAEAIGLYFDGSGDCKCCGNRWSDFLVKEDAKDIPSIYGNSVLGKSFKEFYKTETYCQKWIPNGPECYVHYLDGKIVGCLE